MPPQAALPVRIAVETAMAVIDLIRSDELPYRSPSGLIWDSGSFTESLELACDVVDYARLRAEQRRDADARRDNLDSTVLFEIAGAGHDVAGSTSRK